ncbi:acetyltransferase [Nocardia aurantiaca]|uniref:Acetyltransferase n=1 Tax=Nocardia aurantiaca TaxID=2675850 RepID=A0A6I3L2S7_9NOCA|nr:acetyltransferase [Nocardia aurantiaca]MTE16167.1 acetyltransferase [Nocardia aurantiaca]
MSLNAHTDDLGQNTAPVLRACEGPDEWPALVRIWRSAVEATHDFLTPEDIDFYEERIANEYLAAVTLTVATVDDVPVGFSGTADGKLEMLFIDRRQHGRGVGTALLRKAIDETPDLLVDVNEQNPQAVGFYERHGFVTLARSDIDADGRPFPILHLGRRTR